MTRSMQNLDEIQTKRPKVMGWKQFVFLVGNNVRYIKNDTLWV